jgi:predicted nucleic acid-binding protein
VAIASYLADTSATARLHHPEVTQALGPLLDRGLVATCGILELELTFAARAGDVPATRRRRSGLEWLDTADEDFRVAMHTQVELAERGHHRAAALPDLLVAAVALRHRVAVVHYDGDFDLISAVTGQPTQWVVPRGSVA